MSNDTTTTTTDISTSAMRVQGYLATADRRRQPIPEALRQEVADLAARLEILERDLEQSLG